MLERFRSMSWLVGVIAAVFVVGGCGLFETPAGVAKRFMASVEDGEIDDALDCLSPRFVTGASRDKLRQVLSEQALELKRKGGIKSMKITKEDVVGTVGDIVMTITYGDGSSSTENFKLAKEDGRWKIQGPK